MKRSRAQMRYDNTVGNNDATGHHIIFDYHTDSVVAVCDCGWRELTLSRAAVHDAATQHLLRVLAGPGRRLLYHGPQDWHRDA